MRLKQCVKNTKALLIKYKSYFNDFLINQLDNLALRRAKKSIDAISHLHQPFFMVVTPGSLHIVEVCLALIPKHIEILLILNGINKWEEKWIDRHLASSGKIFIKRMPRRIIKHGKILDFLFENYKKPFGIIDFDCFVFDPKLFNILYKLNENSILNALFLRADEVIDVPGTFILFFNTPIINKIKKKYHVNCDIVTYSQISKNVKERLKTIGFSEGVYPQKGMNFFDMLTLLIALGMADGYQCKYLKKIPGTPGKGSDNHELFHVGGTTMRSKAHLRNPSFERFRLRGAFFWYRLLEVRKDDDLKKRYQKKIW